MFDKWSLRPVVVDKRDALKSEHLLKGIPAITACIGEPKDHAQSPEIVHIAFHGRKDSAPGSRNVDYSRGSKALEREGFRNAGPRSFVISPVDDMDKYTQDLYECFGIIVAGRSNETGRDISFLCHADPFFFWNSLIQQGVFLQALSERMEELKSKCDAGTIDAVIIGGDSSPATAKQKAYRDSINLIAEETARVLGFEPAALTGPKLDAHQIDSHSDGVYYVNAHRRAYIIRAKVGDSSTESFLPRKVRDQETKWQKEWENNEEYMLDKKAAKDK